MPFNPLLKMKQLELEATPVEDVESDSDDDSCSAHELNSAFKKAHLLSEAVISKDKYILSLACTRNSTLNIGAALSDDTFEIFTITNNNLAHVTALDDTKGIVDCKFTQTNNDLLYTCSKDGLIQLWDLRVPTKAALNFVDSTSNGTKKTFNCFDTSPNERLLASGTDLFEGDSFLLFWDLRNANLLGGYWEAHTDDITQVKFDTKDSNKLLSGSTDGLINIYDLSQDNEEDALIDSLNTESSVEVLQWYRENNCDFIACITHTADLQLWKTDDAEPYKDLGRSILAQKLKRKSENYIYLVDALQTKTGLLVLAGSNSNDGECLRALKFNKGNLVPALNFAGNTQRVRCTAFNETANHLFTGGEKGILNLWKVDVL